MVLGIAPVGFSCQMLEERADERIKISKFHKRMIMKPPQGVCESEFALRRITQGQQNQYHIFAENSRCSVYLMVELVSEEWFGLEGQVFLNAETINLFQGKIKFLRESTGWGSRFILKYPSGLLQIYMNSGSLTE